MLFNCITHFNCITITLLMLLQRKPSCMKFWLNSSIVPDNKLINLMLECLRWINNWSLCTSSVNGAERPKARVVGDEVKAMEGEGGRYFIQGFADLERILALTQVRRRVISLQRIGQKGVRSEFCFHRIIWIFCYYYILTRQGQKPRSYSNNLSETWDDGVLIMVVVVAKGVKGDGLLDIFWT